MKRILWAGFTAALLAAGCGGGGGDGGTPGPVPVPVPSTPVTITANNQVAVASAAANVFVGLGGATGAIPLASGERVAVASKSAVFTPSVTVPGARTTAGLLVRLSVASLRAPLAAMATHKPTDVVTTQAIIPLQPQQCPSGGTVSGQLDDRDGNQTLSAGDVATLTFTNCRDGTDTINGSVTVGFTTINATATQITATMSFSSLAVVTSDGSASLNGGLSLNYSEQPNGNSTTALTIGSDGLTSRVVAVNPPYDETLTLSSGLTLTETVDLAALPPGGGVPGLSTLTVNGTAASSLLNGTITISTVMPVKAYDADFYPREGQILVTGAANSKLRMTALSATTVRLELDANGDGTFELTTDKLWSEIL